MHGTARVVDADRYGEQATTSIRPLQRPVGELLREWRESRHLSQLEFSLQAGISARHLSFVETGRSLPSREMILRLAEQLDVPLRERNHLLLAAGFAPAYAETPLDSPAMAAVRAAVRQVLGGHEPYPAMVVDRGWNLVDANASLAIFLDGVAQEVLTPVANCMRIALHPNGLAPRIINLGEWRAHLLGRLRRQIARTADAELSALFEEVAAYPCNQTEPDIELPGPGDIFAPLRIRHEGQNLSFFGTVATFGSALDITAAELSIESFYPADAETAAALRSRQV
ncbi:MAG: helix-turn-helix domain-containing protein [Nitrososphaerota archaeon]